MSKKPVRWNKYSHKSDTVTRMIKGELTVLTVPGYVSQAISVAHTPDDHHDLDLQKAANILKLNHMPRLAADMVAVIRARQAA